MASRWRLDHWLNALTGLGSVRDKVQQYVFQRAGRVDDETLEAMYDEDDMASRIADSVPEHMMRRSFGLECEEIPDLGEKVHEYLEALEGEDAITDAMVWERVFGGGVVVIGVDDGQDVSLPLDESGIESIRFLNVLDRRDCVPIYWYSDPQKPKYGRPEVYRVTYLIQGIADPRRNKPVHQTMTLEVHESRMLVFRGGRATVRNRFRYNGWGAPLLSKLKGPLRGFHGNWQAVENLMQDASQGVYKVKGFFDAITAKKLDQLEYRMQMIDMARSVARAIIVDADGEEFERKDTTMSGLPELIDRTGTRLASAARMPGTVLHGISPAGLNATGASDIRNWYDELEAQRGRRLAPKVRYLVRLVLLAKDGPTQGRLVRFKVTFPSLWQETKDEGAQVLLNKINALVAAVQGQIITPEEAAIKLATDGDLDLDVDARVAAIEEFNKKLSEAQNNIKPAPLLNDNPKTPGGDEDNEDDEDDGGGGEKPN